eukprot:gene11847-biopygen19912
MHPVHGAGIPRHSPRHFHGTERKHTIGTSHHGASTARTGLELGGNPAQLQKDGHPRPRAGRRRAGGVDTGGGGLRRRARAAAAGDRQ